jgi:hypothetical protein
VRAHASYMDVGINNRRDRLTVNKAIMRGQLVVNIPVMIIMFGTGYVLYQLSSSHLVHKLVFLPGSFVLAPLIAWVYWSFAITKWRIWALTNVEDHFELKQDAITGGLIWEDGSFFERTEIRSAKEKKIIYELEKRYNSKKEKQRFKDDLTIPDISKISYSKINLKISIILMSFCLTIGIYLLLGDNSLIYGVVLTTIGIIFGIKDFKKLTNDSTPLILANSGLTIGDHEYIWDGISEEKTSMEGFGKNRDSYLIFWADGEFIKTNIDDYDTTLAELRKLLKIHRGRFDKKINSNNT